MPILTTVLHVAIMYDWYIKFDCTFFTLKFNNLLPKHSIVF